MPGWWARFFLQLSERGRIDTDWLASQVRRLDDPSGDIDTLLQRMAFIRTWTYVEPWRLGEGRRELAREDPRD